jgi:Flp pilus assembly protein CpaB
MKLSQKRLARPSIGGMLATRQGALLLAFLCAVVAGGLVLIALNQYRQNLVTTNKQATVLVAAGEIQKGTSGEAVAAQRLFKVTPVVSTQVQPGALSDSTFLAGKVAQVDILPGQQLTLADFTAVAGVAGQLQPGQRAVSVSIDEAHGDTDVVQTGDRVDVYAALSENGAPALALLVPNALILKAANGPVAGTAPPAPAAGGAAAAPAPSGGSSVVLAVSTADAPKVAYVADNGKLWMLLRPANATAPAGGFTTLNSILSSSPGLGKNK